MLYNINYNRDYLKLKKSLGENPRSILVRNICDNAKISFISTFEDVKKLVVLPDERKALLFYEDYKFYDKNVYYFGEKDLLFDNASIEDQNLLKSRMSILKKLLSGEKITLIATISSCLEKLPSLNILYEKIIKISKDDEIDFDEFVKKLTEAGYKRVSEVSGVGEFAVRGGIIDIYDISSDLPFRIEFFANEIESIRTFNIDTKRSVENIMSVEIFPYSDNLKNEDGNDNKINLESGNKNTFILDYFKEDSFVFLDEPKRINDKINLIIDMLIESRENRMILENELDYDDENKIKPLEIFDSKYVLDRLTDINCIQLTSFDDAPYVNDEKFKHLTESWDFDFDFNMTTPLFNKKDYEDIKKELKKLLSQGFAGLIVLNSHTRAKRLMDEFLNEDINVSIIESLSKKINENNLAIYVGELSSGFIDHTNKFFIFTEKDLFDINREKRKKIIKNKYKSNYLPINDLCELKLGDYVIHDNYGVGIFRGIERLKTDDIEKDYVKIEYADGGFLYVLATKLEVLERYASKSAIIPKINSLGSSEFVRLKAKVKEDILETAKDLVMLYAKRKEAKGYIFSKDNIWQTEFEETFPYIETFDQLMAIENVKCDMESDKTMDRLLCGDVGFGKTEVAIRAAFKACQDGKQVAYLVPTTLLCMQHYKTFKERFEKYPINIDFLSRFKSVKKNNETIENLKNGKVDIVIGTHRIISDDVSFKDLGLLIIDEEQRFGVSHKEKIKRIKNNVDALTLTATPIPRTLYMSLSGIRDLSMLTEAPPERMPIKTYVLEYNEELIREAISRELKREGQVFIVHNRVSDIYSFANKIEAICPYAKVVVAHGKLKEEELSNVMIDFIDKKYNVLITTTIIETGLDIQNANTLIIDNAEKFGLAQLYQLRGRVGRSNRTAYAFFMYNKNKDLTEEELSRLKAIKENTALGSGIKIALKDLEIRGAGNILGLSQSGHIETIGYDLYMKLLNDAVKFLQEESNKGSNLDTINAENFVYGFDTVVDIDINAYIPSSYIEDEELKLEIYRKISKCESEEEFQYLYEELKDRFGAVPKEVDNLMFIAKLKVKAHKYYVVRLNIKMKLVSITFAEKHKIDPQSVIEIVNQFAGKLRVQNDKNVSLIYKAKEQDEISIENSLKIADLIIENLKLKEV